MTNFTSYVKVCIWVWKIPGTLIMHSYNCSSTQCSRADIRGHFMHLLSSDIKREFLCIAHYKIIWIFMPKKAVSLAKILLKSIAHFWPLFQDAKLHIFLREAWMIQSSSCCFLNLLGIRGSPFFWYPFKMNPFKTTFYVNSFRLESLKNGFHWIPPCSNPFSFESLQE